MRQLKDPDFNYHSKCEKLNITCLSFVDDLLLFARGNVKSIKVLMEKFYSFSKSTRQKINPSMCHIYFSVVDDDTKEYIKKLTSFKEGTLPFRYLGAPLTSKKLSIQHYIPLIEKIVGRVTHYSAKLPSYEGRVQLIQSVNFSIMNFWMQCLLLSKKIIQKIDIICRSFMWIGGKESCKKSLNASKQVCILKNRGGLNLISIENWKKTNLIKILWNLNEKTYNLWIKWIHIYYLKHANLMDVRITSSCS